MTIAEVRSDLMDSIPLNTGAVRSIKNAALDAERERSQDDAYFKCPRCYGHHSIHGNFDNLCDTCVTIILEHFPRHESVPHIRAALAKWHKTP